MPRGRGRPDAGRRVRPASAGPPRDRPPPPAAPGTFGVRILAVSEVTRAIRGAVRADPRLADLWVEGEIGRVTISSAGHAYFALKDERNQLQCVWFRDDRLRSAFEAQAGLRVVAHGRVDLFEPQGALQLYVESIQPAGLGDLTLRFEALKARLAAEGLFDIARKRPLPVRPATIAVITSPTGAVWKDICTRPRAALAADPRRPGRRPGPGRRRAGQPRRRVPQGRALRGGASARRAGPTKRPPSRSWPAAAARSRTCGRSTTRSSSGRSSPMPCPSCAGSVTRPTSRWPTSRPTSGRPTPSAAAEIVVPDRAEFLAARSRRADAGSMGPRPRACGRRPARSSPSDGRSTGSARRRSSPAHANASACCSTGRRGRSARSLPRAGGWRTGWAGALAPTLPGRLGRDRGRLERLGVLDCAGRAPDGGRSLIARLGGGGPRRPGAAGDARSWLRHRPPRRRRRDRARPGGGAGRDASGRCASHAASCPRRPTSADAPRRMPDLTAVVVFVVGRGRRGRRRDLAWYAPRPADHPADRTERRGARWRRRLTRRSTP